MNQWTLEPCHRGCDCGFVIRGEDGRTVAHVQYEKDAKAIMAAIGRFAATNQPQSPTANQEN